MLHVVLLLIWPESILRFTFSNTCFYFYQSGRNIYLFDRGLGGMGIHLYFCVFSFELKTACISVIHTPSLIYDF